VTLIAPYAVFIIDHLAQQQDVAQWYQQDLDESPLHISVFAGTEYQSLAEVGPQLLYTPIESELYLLAKHQLEQTGAGAVFYTESSFKQVSSWARKAVTVATEHGSALCRFFELSFLTDACQVLGEQRFWQHLDPVSQIGIYQHGEWTDYQPSPGLKTVDVAQPLFISDQEFKQLTQLRERRFYQQLTNNYHGHIVAINPFEWVQAQCQIASSFGFETHYLNEQWLRAALQFGEAFYQAEVINQHLEPGPLTPLRRWLSIEKLLAANN